MSRARASDDRPTCATCHDYMDLAALDCLTPEDWAMRSCALVCTECERRIALAETRAIAIAEARTG